MKLGSWTISSINPQIDFWSKNDTLILAQFNKKNLATFELTNDDEIKIESVNCCIFINAEAKNINIKVEK